MKTTICFIRHGQTDVNKSKKIQGRKDYPLNSKGKEQAELTGKYLNIHDNKWDYIYSSPLSRAYETANIIKNIINFKGEVIKNEDFIERDFGMAEDQPITDEIFKYILNDEIDNLEKSYQIQERVSKGVLKLHKKHPGKRILIVAHSHTIKGLLTYLDKNRTFTDPLFNCSMSYFYVNDDNKIIIDKVNINPDNN